jgi:hypothetical protein
MLVHLSFADKEEGNFFSAASKFFCCSSVHMSSLFSPSLITSCVFSSSIFFDSFSLADSAFEEGFLDL